MAYVSQKDKKELAVEIKKVLNLDFRKKYSFIIKEKEWI